MSETASHLPRWQCHKQVQADRVVEVVSTVAAWRTESGMVIPVSDTLARRVPDGTDPVGGYYVLYEDGFESWSPAQAFDEGYTRLTDSTGGGIVTGRVA